MSKHEDNNVVAGQIDELTEEELEMEATADAAIELAFLLYRARQVRGLTQAQAARASGFKQQAVSRFEKPDIKLANTKLDTLRKYLNALNYAVHVGISDVESGALVGQVRMGCNFGPQTSAESGAGSTYDAQASRQAVTTQGGAVAVGHDELVRATRQSAVA